MGPGVIIVTVIFGVIFGIFYLFISARNRERLALIDKGADASIFYGKRNHVTPIWKVIVINLALLLVGIGTGIFLASMLEMNFGVAAEVAYPGTIFLLAGVGLLAGFLASKKLGRES